MSRVDAFAKMRLSAYPQRHWPREGMLDAAAAVAGGVLRRVARRLSPDLQRRRFVREVNRLGEQASGMSDAQLRQNAIAAGHRMRRTRRFGGTDCALAVALIREACSRTLHMKPYDVQIAGGYSLLRQTVAEMRTGEGKTLAAAVAAATAALAGIPVHVVTVNDYLAERDAAQMSVLYGFFGLSVGVVRHGISPDDRRDAYDCDIAYCTNKEVAFDYLRDVLTLGSHAGELQLRCEKFLHGDHAPRKTLLRGLYFAIVDEADSVLVDEARTPLVISRPAPDTISNRTRAHALQIARDLSESRHFELIQAERRVELTPSGRDAIAAAPAADDTIWQVQVVREELVRQAISAIHLFHRDRDYIVQEGAIAIVDEHTGRLMEDRFWSVGLHQMVEMKEGCEPSATMETMARMTYQRFFRRYCMLAGMSGTVSEVAGELWQVYRLRVARIPTNRPQQVRMRRPVLCRTKAEKWDAIASRAGAIHLAGAPVLIGTGSVETSLEASRALARTGLAHVVLNAEQSREEADIVAVAGERNAITVATNMAGRGTDIKLGDGVARLGGLHVIMAERNDSRRVDRQLRGRCGRQGDPGSFEAILSLDDDLLKTWTPLLSAAAGALHPLVGSRPGRSVMWLAQRRAETVHARMRRDLLKSDRSQGDRLAFSGRQE